MGPSRHEPGAGGGIFSEQRADNFGYGIAFIGDAEENFHRPGVILPEPALQRIAGGGVAAFERLENGDRGRKIFRRDFPVQRKLARGQPLPERESAT